MERAPFLSAGAPVTAEHLPQALMDADDFPENEITDVLSNPAEMLANYNRRSAPDIAPPPERTRPTGNGLLSANDEQAERDRITEALDQCGGNQTRAAKFLGISRRTLINRLDAFGMPRPRKRTGEHW
jgi:DNA-binding NtrC family response regulator